MSITKFRGCFSAAGPIVAILVGLTLVVGFLYQRGGNGPSSPSEKAALGDVAFSVGGQDVYQNELTHFVSTLRQGKVDEKGKNPAQLPELSPSESFDLYSTAVLGGIQEGAVWVLAKKEGIEPSERDIGAVQEAQLKQQIDEAMSRMSMQTQLTTMFAQQQLQRAKAKNPNGPEVKAAQKKIDDAQREEADFKKRATAALEQGTQQIHDKLKVSLNDALEKRQLTAQAEFDMLRRKYEAQVDVSDTALKQGYDKLIYQQITINDPTGGAKTKAEAVLAKIKSGMDFKEAAMQFTTLKDPKGKPNVADQTKTRFDAVSDKSIRPLLKIKPGEVSEVTEVGPSAFIYKLAKVQPDAPKDFDKQKADRAKLVRTTVATARLGDELEELRKPSHVQWKDQGWKLVYDVYDLQRGDKYKELQGGQNKQKRIQAWRDILERSKNTPSINSEIPALTRYLAVNQLDVELPAGPEKAKLQDELLDVYAQVIDTIGTTQLRFQYTNLLLEKKKGDEAMRQLMEIVRSAFPPGPKTTSLMQQAEQLLPKAANLATKDSKLLGDIQKEILQWHKDDAERKRIEAEQKKVEEETKKKNAEEEARLKKEEAAKKNKPAAPPSSQPKPPVNELAPPPKKSGG